MIDVLKRHWPEYLIEGACLALFMVSAFTFTPLRWFTRRFRILCCDAF
jgi:hypothetical protein